MGDMTMKLSIHKLRIVPTRYHRTNAPVSITLRTEQLAGQRFNDLDGASFEALIKRLYEGGGYTAQFTGRTGGSGRRLEMLGESWG